MLQSDEFQSYNSGFLPAFSWILYDFANTIYSMNVVTMYFSLWITVNLARADMWVSVSNSLSMALVAVTMPILGAYSDFYSKRLRFLWWFTLACVLGTAAIGVVGYTMPIGLLLVLLAAVFYVVANYAYQGALVFYNALLPVVAPPSRMGKISGFGVGMGYLGAIVGLLLVMPFVQGEISFFGWHVRPLQGRWETIASMPGHQRVYLDTTVTANDNYQYRITLGKAAQAPLKASSKDTVITLAGRSRRAIVIALPLAEDSPQLIELQRRVSGWGRIGSFIPTGILFFLFALPIFLFVKEPAMPRQGVGPPKLREAFRDVWQSLSDTRRYPGVLRFFIAKFFYEEGIQTAIIFMAVYAVKVMGFSNEILIPFFMLTTSAAAVGSSLFGYVTDRLGPKPTLLLVIGGWLVCLTVIVLVHAQFWFWILGGLVGIFMGSTWTSARPLLITLVPREKLGEFFGLYSLSGKAAAIFGPLVWGGVVALLAPYGDQVRYRGAVLSLMLIMAVGFVLLWRVPARRLTARGGEGQSPAGK